jgi:ribonuclease HI
MSRLPAAEDFVKLYTDGACSGNPGPGGWAFILEHPASGKVIERFGAEPNTTNNRMEIEGALRGLEILKRPCRVELVTDSQYLAKGINEWLPGWRANGYRRREGNKLKPLQNDDQWRAVDALLARHQVRVVHVRGHAGHPQNERCDQLAVAAYKTLGRRAAAGTAAAQARPARAIEPASAVEPDLRSKSQPIEVEEPAQQITRDLPATFEPDRPGISSRASDRAGIETASSSFEPVESAPEPATPRPRKPRTPRPRKAAIDIQPASHQVDPANLDSATVAGPGASEQADTPAPRAAARPRSAPKKRAAAPKRSKSVIQPEIDFTDPVVDPREPARWDPDDAID